MSTIPRTVLPALLIAGLMALTPPAIAQDQSPTLKGAAGDIESAGSADIIDSKSIDAIKAMGAYLERQSTSGCGGIRVHAAQRCPGNPDTAVTVSGTQYQQCSNGRWYQVAFEGSQIAYIRIADPR